MRRLLRCIRLGDLTQETLRTDSAFGFERVEHLRCLVVFAFQAVTLVTDNQAYRRHTCLDAVATSRIDLSANEPMHQRDNLLNPHHSAKLGRFRQAEVRRSESTKSYRSLLSHNQSKVPDDSCCWPVWGASMNGLPGSGGMASTYKLLDV
jgi:hypothetical protein